jgi:hypothetical protein
MWNLSVQFGPVFAKDRTLAPLPYPSILQPHMSDVYGTNICLNHNKGGEVSRMMLRAPPRRLSLLFTSYHMFDCAASATFFLCRLVYLSQLSCHRLLFHNNSFGLNCVSCCYLSNTYPTRQKMSDHTRRRTDGSGQSQITRAKTLVDNL